MGPRARAPGHLPRIALGATASFPTISRPQHSAVDHALCWVRRTYSTADSSCPACAHARVARCVSRPSIHWSGCTPGACLQASGLRACAALAVQRATPPHSQGSAAQPGDMHIMPPDRQNAASQGQCSQPPLHWPLPAHGQASSRSPARPLTTLIAALLHHRLNVATASTTAQTLRQAAAPSEGSTGADSCAANQGPAGC